MDRFHRLFWECYSRNCEIENEKVNDDDYERIHKMDREKLYKHLKLFIGGLLEFKNQLKNSENTELAQRNMQFEAIIAKLEADVRCHIAKHYQLRLEIETKNNTIEELNSEIAGERSEVKQLKSRIAQQEKMLEHYKLRLEGKRKSLDINIAAMDSDALAQVVQTKTSRGMAKVLSERQRSTNHILSVGKKLMAPSKSFKSRIGHTRCKSQFSKSLKILIPP